MKKFYRLSVLLCAAVWAAGCVCPRRAAEETSGGAAARAAGGERPRLMLNVGDSITEGFTEEGDYTQKLNANMNWDRWVIFKAARSGSAISHLNGRYWMKSAQHVFALQTGPDLVTVMLGTNDARIDSPHHPKWADIEPDFEKDARSIIDPLKALPSRPELFIVTPPPASDDNRFWVKGSVIRSAVLPHLLNVAAGERTGVIDLWATGLAARTGNGGPRSPKGGTAPTALYQDGVHPNRAGYGLIADKIAQVIKLPRPVIERDGRKLKGVTRGTAAGWQWFRDGRAVPPAEGGARAEFTPSAPGRYYVAVAPFTGTLDRLVSGEVTVK